MNRYSVLSKQISFSRMEKISYYGGNVQIGLENYVLAHGIYGKRWFDDSRWRVKKYRGLELYTDVQTDEERAMEKELHTIRDADTRTAC